MSQKSIEKFHHILEDFEAAEISIFGAETFFEEDNENNLIQANLLSGNDPAVPIEGN
jgi:hypothetical protein